MPAVTLKNLRPDVAAKLDQLEVGAAVLERDARNSVAAEILLEYRQARARLIRRRRALSACLSPFLLTYRLLRSSFVLSARVMRSPHLATALRVLHGWLRQGAIFLSLACAALIVLAGAIMLLAPPD
jgi:hypothetical protein